MNATSASILRTVARCGGFFSSADELAVLAEDVTIVGLSVRFAYDCYRLTYPLASAAWHDAHAGEGFEGAYLDAITCDVILGNYEPCCYDANAYAAAHAEAREALALEVA